MRVFIFGVVSLLSTLFFSSCEKDHIKPYLGQQIYFEHYYINYAWGRQYDHWVIDNHGYVRGLKDKSKFMEIDPENLNRYLGEFTEILYRVDVAEFHYYKKLIGPATYGEIVKEDQTRADFGSSVYNAYYPKEEAYQLVPISEMSDLRDVTNESNSAKAIDKWLKELNAKINYAN